MLGRIFCVPPAPLLLIGNTSSVKVSFSSGNPSHMLLFTKHSHRHCRSRSKSTRYKSVSNSTTYGILCISISGLCQITFQLLCFCRQKRELLNYLVQTGQSCVITHIYLFFSVSSTVHLRAPLWEMSIKSRNASAIYVTVYINHLAKVEMLWGVLEVVSGMSLLVSCHYALLPANICIARQSAL